MQRDVLQTISSKMCPPISAVFSKREVRRCLLLAARARSRPVYVLLHGGRRSIGELLFIVDGVRKLSAGVEEEI